ncbi:MAG: undecaprenyldiphospho-muramoylpentapeptide beta-N-acetylglucosaminyltransferase [Thermodesulfobacteriota bacterium]|nr:undecaprenyldiphospho-muramoylpentapeptide beta-N-acetylglucosaminyltransferase [Thermodesulfobacteriota bacterium]
MIGKRKHSGTTGPGVIVTGGGTGGHLFPGIAIAERLRERQPGMRVLFVSTGTPVEKRVLPRLGFDFERIPAEGLKGRRMTDRLRAIVKLTTGLGRAARILVQFKPALVVGMGGYSSAPVVLCAWLFGIRIVLHEQNALPGITNRLLCRFADCVFVTYEEARDRLKARNIIVSGNPLRREILNALKNVGTAVDDGITEAGDKFSLLVIGGSQGAHSLNQTMMDAMKKVTGRGIFSVVHQTGPVDEAMVRRAYEQAGIECTVKAFFDDMAGRYIEADLVVCRSGATTVAEIACVGKPAIFVPFPHAADNHQAYNAQALVAAGAAEMVAEADLSGDLMAGKIDYYVARRDVLARMAERAKQAGRPDAGNLIVDECLALMASPANKRAVFHTCI